MRDCSDGRGGTIGSGSEGREVVGIKVVGLEAERVVTFTTLPDLGLGFVFSPPSTCRAFPFPLSGERKYTPSICVGSKESPARCSCFLSGLVFCFGTLTFGCVGGSLNWFPGTILLEG